MYGPVPGQWLARSASATGTAIVSGSGAIGYLPGTADGRHWGNKLWFAQCSGNPVSASLLVHPFDTPNAGPWLVVTSWLFPLNITGSGQLTAHYPWQVLRLDWVSGGARTGVLNFYLAGGR